MKQLKILCLLLASLVALASKAHSEATNQFGSPVFGAQLSVSVSNNVIMAGSKIFLHCLIRNSSTNDVIFMLTDTRLMYEVSLIDDSGKNFELNNPDNYDGDHIMNSKVSPGESREYYVPLMLNVKIKPGNYKIVAKQRIHIFRKPDRQGIQRGELVSNKLDVQIK